MSTDEATMPAVAPGTWTIVQNPGAENEVRVSFENAQNPAAVSAQLDRWNATLIMAKCSSVALPQFVRHDGTPTLHFPVPKKIGHGLTAPTPDAILVVLRTVATALDALHARRCVHGALAFPSLWWISDTELQFPDAGLAHALDGLIKTTAEAYNYRAPEVWHGRAPTAASDQFSLAVMAYELFTGRTRSNSAPVEGIVSIEPIMLESKALAERGAPIGIAEVLQRALAMTPVSRYENCVALVDAIAQEYGKAKPRTLLERRMNRRRKLSAPTVLVGIAGVVAIAVAVYAASHKDDTRALVARTQARVRILNSANSNDVAVAANSRAGTAALGQAARISGQLSSTVTDARVMVDTSAPNARIATPGALFRGVLGDDALARSTLRSPFSDAPVLPTSGDRLNSFPSSLQFASRATEAVSEAVGTLGTKLDPLTPALRKAAEDLRNASLVNGTADAILDDPRPTDRGNTPPATLVPPSTVIQTAATNPPQPASSGSGKTASGNGTGAQTSGPPLRSTFSLLRFSLPSNSRLYVDGQLVRNQEQVMRILPGIHDVVVLTSEGGTVRKRLTLNAGDTTMVRVP